jgi:hypothetical protein
MAVAGHGVLVCVLVFRVDSMNLNQIIAQLVRAAEWQLMRRSPTWLLCIVVLGAFAWALLKH